jgi:hypothetical protein
MSEWITGEELRASLNFRDFEFYNFLIENGIQPHNRSGHPLAPPDVQEKRESLESLENRLKQLRIELEDLPNEIERRKRNALGPRQMRSKHYVRDWVYVTNISTFGVSAERERFQKYITSTENSIRLLKDELPSPEDYHWGESSPPLAESEEEIFNIIVGALYKKNEVRKIKSINQLWDQKSELSGKKIASAPEPQVNSFILKGEYWSIRYEGSDEINVRNLERIRYIVHLLEKPRHSFSARELKRLVKGEWHESDIESDKDKEHREEKARDAGLSIEGSQGEILSDEEMKGLKNTMYKSWEKLNAAKDTGKEERISNAQQEFNSGASYMYNEYGLKVTSSNKGLSFKKCFRSAKEANNTRLNVTMLINNAKKDFEKDLPELRKHLDTYIHTGKVVEYGPPVGFPEWRVRWNS